MWINSNILDSLSLLFLRLSSPLSPVLSFSLSEDAKATGLLLGRPARNPVSLFIEGEELQGEYLQCRVDRKRKEKKSREGETGGERERGQMTSYRTDRYRLLGPQDFHVQRLTTNSGAL